MILIQEDDFCQASAYTRLREADPTGTGAICTFTGLVRDFGDTRGVNAITLEHYPGMTEKSLANIVEQARQRWHLLSTLVIHRVGKLQLGEQIVFVGVSAAHRGDAFAATQFIMDYLKTEAPFWKKEHHAQGEHWVDAKTSDEQQRERWKHDSSDTR